MPEASRNGSTCALPRMLAPRIELSLATRSQDDGMAMTYGVPAYLASAPVPFEDSWLPSTCYSANQAISGDDCQLYVLSNDSTG